MKHFLTAFLALSFLLAGSCGGVHKPVNWTPYVDCAPGVSDLVGTVTGILMNAGPADQATIGDRAKTELSDLAAEHGADTVACLVQRLVTDWTAPGAAQEPLRVAAASRGRDFLGKVGTTAHLSEQVGSQ